MSSVHPHSSGRFQAPADVPVFICHLFTPSFSSFIPLISWFFDLLGNHFLSFNVPSSVSALYSSFLSILLCERRCCIIHSYLLMWIHRAPALLPCETEQITCMRTAEELSNSTLPQQLIETGLASFINSTQNISVGRARARSGTCPRS